MKLGEGQRVVVHAGGEGRDRRSVLTATENGFGKRTPIAEYPRHGRGGQGMIAIQTSERNGEVVGAVLVDDNDEVMLISTGGVLIRTARDADPRDGPLHPGRDADLARRGREARRPASASRSATWRQRQRRQRQRQRRQRRRATRSCRRPDGSRRPDRPLMSRIFNFSAGPAMLPAEVLARAGDEMLDWRGSGMSVMEMSHRGKEFMAIAAEAEKDLRELLGDPGELQGAVPAGRRHAAVRADADEPAARQGQGRLREHRRMVEEGDRRRRRSIATCTSPPRSEDQNFTYAPKNVERQAGRGLRALLLQRDHRRRRVSTRSRKSRAFRWSPTRRRTSCRARSTSRSSA